MLSFDTVRGFAEITTKCYAKCSTKYKKVIVSFHIMYSPKIREDLIPIIYQMGKEQRKPMTRVVDDIIRDYVKKDGKYFVRDAVNGKRQYENRNELNNNFSEKKIYCLDDLE